MSAKAGLALKALQWLIRLVQLLSAALVLAVYSYFLAALHSHGLDVPTHLRAVVYSIVGLLLLCCLAGLAVASAAAALVDLAFVGAFVYVVVANHRGAASCRSYRDTPLSSGSITDDAVAPRRGFTPLPSLRAACRLQTAVLAVAIVAIGFFLFSILVEVALARHHRKAKRFGPSPANYTSGYGSSSSRPAGPGSLLGRFRRNRNGPSADDNTLPEHIHPDQLDDAALPPPQTDGADFADHAKPEAGYGYSPSPRQPRQQAVWHAAPHGQYHATNY